jgi:hypothetical protein
MQRAHGAPGTDFGEARFELLVDPRALLFFV